MDNKAAEASDPPPAYPQQPPMNPGYPQAQPYPNQGMYPQGQQQGYPPQQQPSKRIVMTVNFERARCHISPLVTWRASLLRIKPCTVPWRHFWRFEPPACRESSFSFSRDGFRVHVHCCLTSQSLPVGVLLLYIVAVGQHSATTVVVSQPGAVVINNRLGPNPANTTCTYCQAHITTSTTRSCGGFVWMIAGIICLVGYATALLLQTGAPPKYTHPALLLEFENNDAICWVDVNKIFVGAFGVCIK